jgi:hypothetical protein
MPITVVARWDSYEESWVSPAITSRFYEHIAYWYPLPELPKEYDIITLVYGTSMEIIPLDDWIG